MSKINTDYSTITDNPAITIYYPEMFVDIKVILMALRWEMASQPLHLARFKFLTTINVIVPTLATTLKIRYANGFITVKSRRKKYRIPCELENFMVPEWAIDALVELFIYNDWHTKRFRF